MLKSPVVENDYVRRRHDSAVNSLMMVRHTIVERADYRSHVEAAIRQSTSGPQRLSARWWRFR